MINKWREYIANASFRTIERQQNLQNQRRQILELFDTIVTIEKKTNHQGQLSYILNIAVHFTSFPEFLEQFHNHHTIFLSSIDPQKKRYSNKKSLASFTPAIHYEQTIDLNAANQYILSHIKSQCNIIMILTDNALRAKQLFEIIYRNP